MLKHSVSVSQLPKHYFLKLCFTLGCSSACFVNLPVIHVLIQNTPSAVEYCWGGGGGGVAKNLAHQTGLQMYPCKAAR